MRKLIVSEFMTLDGVIEAPGGEPSHPHTNWAGDALSEAEIANRYREILECDSLLLGRVTYESFAGAWPTYEGPFADKMNGMPKHVVSSTLTNPEWNNTSVISGDIWSQIQALKGGEGGPILVTGSKTLVHALFERGLVDELRAMIFPVILGSGFKLFPESPAKIGLTMTDAVIFPSGIAAITYAVGAE